MKTRRHLLAIAAVNLAAVLAASPLSASTPASLGHVVIGELGAGYVVMNPGPHDGASSLVALTAFGSRHGALDAYIRQFADAAYVRTFDHSPGGGIVTILAVRFGAPGAVSRFLHELERSEAGVATRTAVSQVSGALAYTGGTDVAGFALHRYAVAFRRGDVGIVVAVTTRTGDLSIATAIDVARHQSSAMSSPTASRPSALVGMGIGGAITAVAVLSALFVVRRKDDDRPDAGRAGAARTEAPAASAGPPGRSGPMPPPHADAGAPQGTVARTATQTMQATPSIYCSWCGKQRSSEQLAIHHCGSRDRPPRFCSACGASLKHEQLVCGVCGTSSDLRS